jgi:hypothetical protein
MEVSGDSAAQYENHKSLIIFFHLNKKGKDIPLTSHGGP